MLSEAQITQVAFDLEFLRQHLSILLPINHRITLDDGRTTELSPITHYLHHQFGSSRVNHAAMLDAIVRAQPKTTCTCDYLDVINCTNIMLAAINLPSMNTTDPSWTLLDTSTELNTSKAIPACFAANLTGTLITCEHCIKRKLTVT